MGAHRPFLETLAARGDLTEPIRRRCRAARDGVGGVVVVIGLLSSCTTAREAEDSVADAPGPGVVLHSYPTNADGLSYGSRPGIPPDEEPDLIGVIGDNGVRGYVLKTELDKKSNANPANPAAALRRQQKLLEPARAGELKVRVWNLEGEQIGWLTLDAGDG